MKRWKNSRTVRGLTILTVVVLSAISVFFIAEGSSAQQAEQETQVSEETMKLLENTDQFVAQAGLGEKEPVIVETSKEIVKDTVISSVPSADYSYNFNGNLGNAVAVTRQGDVGGFNDGTYPEADESVTVKYTDGMEGSALYLDGTYGVELLGVDQLADSYTISFWFRPHRLCDWSPFLSITHDMLNETGSENYLSFNKKTNEDGSVVAPVFNTINANLNNSCEIRPSQDDKNCLVLNQWNYITVRVDATQVDPEDDTKVMGYLYLNSELIGTAVVSRMNFPQNDLRVYVGISCYDELFEACYDEIRIWNTLLDENQISALYVAYQK